VADLSLDTVLKATQARVVGAAPEVFRGVSTDTRTLTAGSLFVALRGERFDGHEFVGEALQRGAGGALVSRESGDGGPLLVVPDTLAALGSLAAAHRASFSIHMVAVTGSTGKTTTKEMIAAILSQGWRTARTPGNYNNEIGVPLALLDLDASHRAAVVELAMRGKGQIGYLAQMARPQVAVITNIGVSHFELLGSREAIAEAKAELLAHLPEHGVAVLNADDDFFGFLEDRSPARVVSFGRSAAAQVRPEGIEVTADGCVTFSLWGPWGEDRVSLRAAGRHQAFNAAAAAAAAAGAGAPAEWIPAGLEAFEAADMRGRISEAPGGFTLIDDCYNAAPDSMRVALELLADLPGNDKWAVLGDMKELGPLAAEWHREVGELAASMGITGLIALGELGHHIAEAARRRLPSGSVIEAADIGEAAQAAADRLRPGDVVLVKASRAMRMEEVVARLLGQRGGGREQSG
jgi:UDP-N-acetylmuramoyl-tripeptide--D-alanyl-D-alanine ligase